jgi:hypothetical protein
MTTVLATLDASNTLSQFFSLVSKFCALICSSTALQLSSRAAQLTSFSAAFAICFAASISLVPLPDASPTLGRHVLTSIEMIHVQVKTM